MPTAPKDLCRQKMQLFLKSIQKNSRPEAPKADRRLLHAVRFLAFSVEDCTARFGKYFLITGKTKTVISRYMSLYLNMLTMKRWWGVADFAFARVVMKWLAQELSRQSLPSVFRCLSRSIMLFLLVMLWIGNPSLFQSVWRTFRSWKIYWQASHGVTTQEWGDELNRCRGTSLWIILQEGMICSTWFSIRSGWEDWMLDIDQKKTSLTFSNKLLQKLPFYFMTFSNSNYLVFGAVYTLLKAM